jgi:hypothetical protein
MEDAHTDRILEFLSVSRYNIDYFLLEFGEDYRHFVCLQERFTECWKTVGTSRDKHKHSHAGLLPLQALVGRSAVYGFHALMRIEIANAWPSMRYAVEGMLIVGKLVAEPSNGRVWADWELNRAAYIDAFQTRLGKDNALPRANLFRKLLKRINDQYLHPNPSQVLDIANVQFASGEGNARTIETTWTGGDRDLIESHVLAFIRVFADLVDASYEMLGEFFPTHKDEMLRNEYEQIHLKRAEALVANSPKAKPVLTELGLWQNLK